MKFIHLTDLHLVAPGRSLYGLDPNARLRAAIADINTNHADAAFVLITGDLAHHGEPAAYEALRAALGELAPPCHLLIGNHDDRAVFLHTFPAAPVDEHGFVQGLVATPAGSFVLIDTHEPGTHEGRLCERRLTWVDRTLAPLRGQAVFLAMHHPPLPLALPAMDALGLRQRGELAELLARHGNVRHIFFGHVHRPSHGTWQGIPFSTLRGLNHQVAMHSGAPTGIPGSHEPPAYAIVLVEEGSVVVHVHDFLDASPRFDLFDKKAERAECLIGRAQPRRDVRLQGG
jgi:3',5'-cyclic-AMP phosphodiesterase